MFVPGEVTLWDNKFRSNPVTMPSSPTFEPGSSALTSALADAQVSIRNSNLPAEAKNLALQNLSKGNFITNTPGSGAVKNSTTVRFCSGIPC